MELLLIDEGNRQRDQQFIPTNIIRDPYIEKSTNYTLTTIGDLNCDEEQSTTRGVVYRPQPCEFGWTHQSVYPPDNETQMSQFVDMEADPFGNVLYLGQGQGTDSTQTDFGPNNTITQRFLTSFDNQGQKNWTYPLPKEARDYGITTDA